MQTIINFFGTGVRYWICRIPQKEYEALETFRAEHKLYWEDVLFDLHVLTEFGYKTWEDFNVILEGSGWLTAERNWLEIKTGRKRRKVLTAEFLGEELMFDLFQKQCVQWEYVSEPETQDVLLIQLETGLMAKYEVNKDKIDLSQVIFEMQPIRLGEWLGMSWVEGLICLNGISRKTKEDTVVRENRIKWINDEEKTF